MHFGPVHQFGSYYLNGIKSDNVESQKDLGILFDYQCKFHLHTTDVAAKANRLLGLIRRFSVNLIQIAMLIKLFVILHWNTAIRYGGHYLLLIKENQKGST